MANPASPRRILIVEDERVVARDLQKALRALGYEVPSIAASAEEALSHASESRPDLVLMDIRIHGGQDGIDAAAALRAQHDPAIVYLTAYADDATLARAKATAPHGYLMKPVKHDELRPTIEIALHKQLLERTIRERERWFSTTLRSIGDAVIATDSAGNVTYMNLMAELLTGHREAACAGRAVSEIVQLEDEITGAPLENPIFGALRERRVLGLPVAAALTVEGGGRPIDECAAPIVDDGGNVLGAVLVLRDVTEQRRLHARATMTERMIALGTMAAGVAHQVNNPLAIVVGNAAELGAKLEASSSALSAGALADMRQLTAEVQDAASRVARVVSDLTTFSRRIDDVQPVDVHAALGWVVRVTEPLVAPRARVIIERTSVPPVLATESGLGQVFVNLLNNAAQAMPDRPIDRNEITIDTRHAGTRVIVSVADNGRGMPPEVHRRMFEPFFTTRPVGQGSGIGLAVAHGIVQSLGGEIAADSSPGRGTTVHVRLPVASIAEPRPRTTSLAAPIRRCSILLIDDDPGLLKALKRTLATEHDVTDHDDPIVALEYLRDHRSVDLILCDFTMPSLTGQEVYERLVATAPDLADRLVFLTGGAHTERGRAFLASMPERYLEKPFSPQSLREFVRRFVAKRASR